MVFESLVGPFEARKKPWKLFLIGILFSVVAIIFSLWVFEAQASMVMVLLVVMMSIPLMYSTIFYEEKYDTEGDRSEKTLLKHHGKTLMFLTLLFLGFLVGFTLLYVFMPGETVGTLFSAQNEAIMQINGVTGHAIGGWADFTTILANNLKVTIFCLFFAFFFGAGAIFILAWNASVIAAAAGNFFRSAIVEFAGSSGAIKAYFYFHVFGVSLLRYLTHGIFEIAAYFVAGLAGGIISVGIIRHGIKSPEMSKTLFDAAILIIISILILLLAALIEVFITPAIF
jgi:uncharacterized membrane protein SpoIIM required for sporulation